jgi:excisionase family DNA binding protein
MSDPHKRLLTGKEAATLVGVSGSTIRMWVSRGHLKPAARRGRTYWYLEADVLHAEQVTRNSGRGGPRCFT